MKMITSKENPRIKFAGSLKENKYRKETGKYLGETRKSMMMALEAGVLEEVFTLEELNLPKNIIQNIVSPDILKKISSNVNPEVVFICHMPVWENIVEDKVLYLDDIQDPGNMGTLIRTALAFSFSEVVVSKSSVSIYNEKVMNSAKGALYKIPVVEKEICSLKQTHQFIVSTLTDKSVDYRTVKAKEPFVLVLGNEAHGVSEEVLALATDFAKIPMNPELDSLNVAVAGGILMAEYSK